MTVAIDVVLVAVSVLTVLQCIVVRALVVQTVKAIRPGRLGPPTGAGGLLPWEAIEFLPKSGVNLVLFVSETCAVCHDVIGGMSTQLRSQYTLVSIHGSVPGPHVSGPDALRMMSVLGIVGTPTAVAILPDGAYAKLNPQNAQQVENFARHMARLAARRRIVDVG